MTRRPSQSIKKYFPTYIVLPHLITKPLFLVGFVIFLVTFGYQWMYAGLLWNPLGRISHLEVALVNHDKGFNMANTPTQIQQLMAELFNGRSAGAVMSSAIMDPDLPLNHVFDWSQLPNITSRDEAIDIISHGDYWAMLYIPSNFSQNFLSATNTATRKPWEAEWIFDQGRNYNTQSFLSETSTLAFGEFSSSLAKQFLTSKAGPIVVKVFEPTFWVDFFQIHETAVHPVSVYGSNFASYTMFVVSYIGCLLTVAIVNLFQRMREASKSSKFPAIQVVIAWGLLAAILTLFQTVAILIPSFALKNHQFDWKNAGYAIAFVWYTSLAFLSILFLLLQLLTDKGFQVPGAMFLILQLTTSGGIISNILQPGIAKIGIAFPMYYGVRGVRSIFYGSLTHKMWINWLVITAWIVIPGVISIIWASYKIKNVRKASDELGDKALQQGV